MQNGKHLVCTDGSPEDSVGRKRGVWGGRGGEDAHRRPGGPEPAGGWEPAGCPEYRGAGPGTLPSPPRPWGCVTFQRPSCLKVTPRAIRPPPSAVAVGRQTGAQLVSKAIRDDSSSRACTCARTRGVTAVRGQRPALALQDTLCHVTSLRTPFYRWEDLALGRRAASLEATQQVPVTLWSSPPLHCPFHQAGKQGSPRLEWPVGPFAVTSPFSYPQGATCGGVLSPPPCQQLQALEGKCDFPGRSLVLPFSPSPPAPIKNSNSQQLMYLFTLPDGGRRTARR